MKTLKISKALEEVWEWKEKCFEEAKKLSLEEYLKKAHRDAEDILKNDGFTKKGNKIKKLTPNET